MDMAPQTWPEWYDGKHINEVLFCQQFLDKHPMKCVRGRLFTVDGLIEDEGQIGNLILEEISGCLTSGLSKVVANLLASIKLQAYSPPLPIETDRIHVANGTYFMDGGFTTGKSYCNNRLTVSYDPNVPAPKRWLQFLSELLVPEDIPTLQEFLGYCLLPTTKGQKMLMLIGRGGEGKSRIGLVMRSLLGDSMNTTSIQKVESNRFSRADLENKLLMVDDDMDMSALPKTNYIKSIVTSECKMDMERKGVQSYQSQLYVRFLCFGNGALTALHDKSDGFFRRQIVLTTKEQPACRTDDPFLVDKLLREKEGIFLWCLEGLHRLIGNNYQFSISGKARENMEAVKRSSNNVIEFLQSEGYIRFKADSEASSKALYEAYQRWCEDNAQKPMSANRVSSELAQNERLYNVEATNNVHVGGKRVRGFMGIEVVNLLPYLPSASSSSYNIWYMSGSSYQTTISLYNAGSSGLNAYFKIKAPSLGNISLTKTTEDGQNLSGWKFGIYSDSACTNLVSGPYTTNSSGKLSVTGLTAGTYYVKELGNTDSSLDALYSCASTNPQRVTIASGQTASVSFYNKCNTGSVMLVKETNTGENLGGWKIGLYYDPDCANPIPDSPFVTGADGTITVTGLQPGTLYAREIPTDDPYWEFDTEVKAVTIQVNQTASVTFTNTQYGRIQIVKTTNTGNHLGGWTFQVRDSSGKTVGEFTTDENGYAITGNLPLGHYTVVELPTEDVYWIGELGFHTVLVTGGKDVVDTWLNKEQGVGWFYKKTNTGENVEGWKITIYSDPECTQEVGTITTNEEGRGGYYLDPGIYYAKETGDEYGRFEDEYWMVDESVQKVEILPHQDTEITFTNVQYGKLKILKTMEDGTTAAGWQFRVTDAAGTEVEGSPFTTSEDGTILETLLPGEYTVEEILPEDSLYVCKSENPQKVSVVQGQIAEVTFINGIRTGRITVQKVDTQRNPLSGAAFLLEWSEDGALWWPVTFSETAIKGGCANADLVDGMLTSGEDGILEWTNLHPGLQYRLTEVKAPNGYKLLPDVAFFGELPADGLTVALTVVNARTFTMPETGAASGTILKVLSLLTALGCLGLLLARKRRP